MVSVQLFVTCLGDVVWPVVLVNDYSCKSLNILLKLWCCSQLSRCHFSPSSAVYSSSGVVFSGLPIFLKFQHHSDTLYQAEYYHFECFRIQMNFSGGNSQSNHRLYDRLLTCCSSTYIFAFLSNRENKFVLLPLDAFNTDCINVSIILLQPNSIEIINSVIYFIRFMGSIAESLMKCV